MIKAYQERHAEAQNAPMVMAVAAPIIEGEVAAQANMPWPVRQAEMRQLFPQVESHLLNDFVALAHAVPTLAESDLHNLCTPTSGRRELGKESVLVMGPGTGLGAALWCLARLVKHQLSSPAKQGMRHRRRLRIQVGDCRLAAQGVYPP